MRQARRRVVTGRCAQEGTCKTEASTIKYAQSYLAKFENDTVPRFFGPHCNTKRCQAVIEHACSEPVKTQSKACMYRARVEWRFCKVPSFWFTDNPLYFNIVRRFISCSLSEAQATKHMVNIIKIEVNSKHFREASSSATPSISES